MKSFHSNWAYRLMEDIFMVSIPDNLTLSREQLEYEGYTITGNDEIDRARRNIRTISGMPIVDSTDKNICILDCFLAGINIGFQSMDDVREICHLISNYLEEWRLNIQNTINVHIGEFKETLLGLQKLHAKLYAILSDDAIKQEMDESEMDLYLGYARPFDTRQFQNEVGFERPEYSERYGSLDKILRDRIVQER